ncbi:MAG: LEA type 2 family protein [candidate division WOR-3 bacterium]
MRYILVLFPLLISCSLIQSRINITSCKFSLKSASLKSVDLSGFNLVITLNAHNPNGIDAILDRLVGLVKLDGYTIAQVSNSYKRVVKAGGNEDIPIDVRVEYSSLGASINAVKNAINRRTGNISFEGKAYVDYEIPVLGKKAFTYPINLSKTLSF